MLTVASRLFKERSIPLLLKGLSSTLYGVSDTARDLLFKLKNKGEHEEQTIIKDGTNLEISKKVNNIEDSDSASNVDYDPKKQTWYCASFPETKDCNAQPCVY